MLTALIAATLLAGSPSGCPSLAVPITWLPRASPAASPAAAPAADPAAVVAPVAPVALVRRVQALYERTRDLTARFTQTYTYAGLGRRAVSTGTLQVKKPGLMRWDYATPSRKTVAVAGKRLVQYEPEENQAFVDERFDATAMSAAVTFLLGTGDLTREFVPTLDAAGGLVLTPRTLDPRVARITLTTGPDGEVLGTAVVDGAGNENRLAFEGLQRNTGLADAAFEVALPKDVRRLTPPGR
jgi:outer membrane lipoprotein carrier protein